MIPYLASIGWCGDCLRGNAPEPPRRRWNRGLIASDELLSIPVHGGITAIKRANPFTWEADDTRMWRRQHIGAINARLGRTPFFHYYAEPVIEVLADTSITKIASINDAIYAIMTEPLGAVSFLREFENESKSTRRRLMEYAESIWGKNRDERLSLLNYLCNYGPDTIFILTFPLLRECLD